MENFSFRKLTILFDSKRYGYIETLTERTISISRMDSMVLMPGTGFDETIYFPVETEYRIQSCPPLMYGDRPVASPSSLSQDFRV